MLTHVLFFFLGLCALVAGAEALVRGASKVALSLGISPLVVGLTIVAFGTRCRDGIDRTPFVAMIYVSKKYEMSYEKAYELVKQKRPQTVFHWDWVKMLPPKVN